LTRREVDALIAWGCQENPDSMDALHDAVDALVSARRAVDEAEALDVAERRPERESGP